MTRIIITSPSLNTADNISGIAEVTRFITRHNSAYAYRHFTLGKRDAERRNASWLLRIIGAYAKWAGVLIAERHAVVHFNFALDWRSVARDAPLILLARIFCRKVFIHVHGGEFLAGGHVPVWCEVMLRLIFSGARLIVLSPLEVGWVNLRAHRGTIAVLPNCVDLAEAESFCRVHNDQGPLRVLFLGRISEQKGIDTLYMAMTLLRARGTQFHFTLAGTGPAVRAYVARFEELLGDAFRYVGVVADVVKTTHMQEADVFVLPSLFEGLPVALLESMAFGVVPIATNVGSIPTVIAHGTNGIIVRKGNSDDIADALERLASDRRQLRLLSLNARHHIFTAFRPDQYIERLNRIYST